MNAILARACVVCSSVGVVLCAVKTAYACFKLEYDGCCLVSSIHPPNMPPSGKCEDQLDCGSIIFVNEYVYWVSLNSPGMLSVLQGTAVAKCEAARGKCTPEGECVYEEPHVTECTERTPTGGSC